MKLRETIRKVLREGLDDKIINLVNSVGIMSATSFVGGYEKLFKILDKYEVTNDMKIRLIKDYVGDKDGVGLNNINMEDIMFKDDDNEQHVVIYLENNGVLVNIWSGHDYDTDSGEYILSYEELPDNVIDEIYSAVISELINNDEYN